MQRRRGQDIVIWPAKLVTDRRGNETKVADPDNKIETRGWVIPQRSARAELPGQQKINVVRIGVNSDLAGVELWSHVEYDGKHWDIVTPPAYHHGTRHNRHWSIDMRERPSG